MNRAQRRKQEKAAGRAKKPMSYDRNAYARYRGPAVDLNIPGQLDMAFQPVIHFMEQVVSGEDIEVDQKGYPVMVYEIEGQTDVSHVGPAMNLMLETVLQSLMLSGEPYEDFNKATALIQRKLSRRMEYGAPLEHADSVMALETLKRSRAWLRGADQNIVLTVVNQLKKAAIRAKERKENFSIGHCREWLADRLDPTA